MSRCKGIGLILGHSWHVELKPVAAEIGERGVFFMHGIGPLKLERKQYCKRRGQVIEIDGREG